MLNSEVPCVRYLIGRIVKTFDYINRVVLTLPLSVYDGTWTTLSPLFAMHRNFFEITVFPNSGIRAWFYALMLYARVEHK